MDQTVTIGGRIAYLLEKENMTQRELANKINVTEVTIGRYVNNTREPKGSILKDIANVFGVSTDYLLGNAPEKQYYIDDETARQAQELMNDSNQVKMLLSASRKLSPEDLEAVITIVNSMRRSEVD